MELLKITLLLMTVTGVPALSARRRGRFLCSDPGWKPVHRACYKFETRGETWPEAQEICQEYGGHLTTINSVSELTQIIEELKQIIRSHDLLLWWVGLRYNAEHRWMWTDGSELIKTVTSWGPGEPNDSSGDEDCAELRYTKSLNDKSCSTVRPYICERPPDPSTTATSPTIPSSLGDSYRSTLSDFQISTNATKPLFSGTSPHAVHTITKNFSHRATTRIVNTRTDASQEGSSGTAKRETEHTTIKSRKDATKSSSPAVKTKRPPIVDKKACFVRAQRRILPRGRTSRSVRMCSPVKLANVDWPKTAGGDEARVPCRSGNGYATWLCSEKHGCWVGEPIIKECASESVRNLLRQVSVSHDQDPESTASALVKVSKAEDMSVEDLYLTSSIISAMAHGFKRKKISEEAVKSIVMNVAEAGGNFLSNKTLAWKKMNRKERLRSATSLMVAMENASVAMMSSLNRPITISNREETIAIELRVVDIRTLKHNEVVYGSENDPDRFSIPMKTLQSVTGDDGLAKLVFMTHFNLAQLLHKDNDDDEPDREPEQEMLLSSNVVSASLSYLRGGNLPEPVTFSLKHTRIFPKNSKPVCSFWKTEESSLMEHWSHDGCSLVDSNVTHTTCRCNHLTNFAILLNVGGVELSAEHQSALWYITFIGCIVSLLCLFISWLTFQLFSSLQCERNSIHKHLVLCLFVAELLFITGINSTGNKVLCSCVAGFLHYFFLAAFTWMLLEGAHILLMVVQVFDAAKSRLPYYYLVGYGLPCLIVVIAASVGYQGYGTATHCWLSSERHFIWSYAGPVAVILLINVIILTYAMGTVCRHSAYIFKSPAGSLRDWIQGCFALEVLLGLTWVFGYFFINKETVVMAYLFTILNSIQGIFIFGFHCLLNKKVRKEYKRLFNITKKAQPSTKSASLGRKQEGSHEQCQTK